MGRATKVQRTNCNDYISISGYNIGSVNSFDKYIMTTSKSVTNISLRINLELGLEISQEDMLIDEVSTPIDE